MKPAEGNGIAGVRFLERGTSASLAVPERASVRETEEGT
jgi:hypothetical protein